jgi:uncharacterized protein
VYERELTRTLSERLGVERRFIQAVIGPRQVGKTTCVLQALEAVPVPSVYATGDEPVSKGASWLEQQWERARMQAGTEASCVLAIDGIQKIDGWADME